jgi:hypothetical protein
MTVVAVWWLSALVTTGWVMVRASTPPPRIIPLVGVYAFLHPPLLGRRLGIDSATATPDSSSMGDGNDVQLTRRRHGCGWRPLNRARPASQLDFDLIGRSLPTIGS